MMFSCFGGGVELFEKAAREKGEEIRITELCCTNA